MFYLCFNLMLQMLIGHLWMLVSSNAKKGSRSFFALSPALFPHGIDTRKYAHGKMSLKIKGVHSAAGVRV